MPPVGGDDHVTGDGPETIVYLDLACPHCAAAWQRLRAEHVRLCFRHFPLASKRPRTPALHAAAEAAGLQRPEAFWAMVDSIYAEHGHQDDPHLWRRAEGLGLDLARFDNDRRSRAVSDRVKRDFESGIRAGVTGTPALFVAGRRVSAR